MPRSKWYVWFYIDQQPYTDFGLMHTAISSYSCQCSSGRSCAVSRIIQSMELYCAAASRGELSALVVVEDVDID
jgi:hypothetical protein